MRKNKVDKKKRGQLERGKERKEDVRKKRKKE